MIRWVINYIRSCFCEHEWEQIFDTRVRDIDTGETYSCKTYRCEKCGYSRKYKSY